MKLEGLAQQLAAWLGAVIKHWDKGEMKSESMKSAIQRSKVEKTQRL